MQAHPTNKSDPLYSPRRMFSDVYVPWRFCFGINSNSKQAHLVTNPETLSKTSQWANGRISGGCPSIATPLTATVGHIFPTTDMTLKAKDERLNRCGDSARLALDALEGNLQSINPRISMFRIVLRENILLAISKQLQIRCIWQVHLA